MRPEWLALRVASQSVFSLRVADIITSTPTHITRTANFRLTLDPSSQREDGNSTSVLKGNLDCSCVSTLNRESPQLSFDGQPVRGCPATRRHHRQQNNAPPAALARQSANSGTWGPPVGALLPGRSQGATSDHLMSSTGGASLTLRRESSP
jgi:hypothetical protein